ncbi:hypothetical protein K4K52_012668 [Colletotrichum sp. SAR 10_76]|nr:hypothetical protein K4K52_012668 [Colletotrichum sp. SAR 10_76]
MPPPQAGANTRHPHGELEIQDARPSLPRPPGLGGRSRKLAALRRPASSEQGLTATPPPSERPAAAEHQSSLAVRAGAGHLAVIPESESEIATAAVTNSQTNSHQTYNRQTNSTVNNNNTSTSITNNYYDTSSKVEVAASSKGPLRIEDGKVAAKDNTSEVKGGRGVLNFLADCLWGLIHWLFAMFISRFGAALLVLALIALAASNLWTQLNSQPASIFNIFQMLWDLAPWSSPSPPSPESGGGRPPPSTSDGAIAVRDHYFGASAFRLAVDVVAYNADQLARSSIPWVAAFARELMGTQATEQASSSLVLHSAANMSHELVKLNNGYKHGMARQLRRESREASIIREAIAAREAGPDKMTEPWWRRLLLSFCEVLPKKRCPLPKPLATARQHLIAYHGMLVRAGRHRNDTHAWIRGGPGKQELRLAQHQMTAMGEKSEAKRRQLDVAADDTQSDNGLAVFAETDKYLEEIANTGNVVGQLLGSTQLQAREHLRAFSNEGAWIDEERGAVEDMMDRVDRQEVDAVVANRAVVKGLYKWEEIKTKFYGDGSLVTEGKGKRGG